MRTGVRSIDRDISNSRQERSAHPIDDTDGQRTVADASASIILRRNKAFLDRHATVESIRGAPVRIEMTPIASASRPFSQDLPLNQVSGMGMESPFVAHTGGMEAFACRLEIAHALSRNPPRETWRSSDRLRTATAARPSHAASAARSACPRLRYAPASRTAKRVAAAI